MTKEVIQQLWKWHFPDVALVPHPYRHVYPDRWFRIHSLPDSQRYAETEEEWNILLNRQNEIITDLFGAEASVILINGEYVVGDPDNVELATEFHALKNFSWFSLDEVDLFQHGHEGSLEGDKYRTFFAEIIWNSNEHDELLRAIANWEVNTCFLSFEKNVIVAPYDGGVDCILKDVETRDYFKNKYKAWLSKREDGL